MTSIKIGIIREGKTPPDRRSPFSPQQCAQLQRQYPGLKFIVQPSEIRCYKNNEFESEGILIQEDLSAAEIIFGVKEVPIEKLLYNKHFFFFSHTHKFQEYNRPLLQAAVKKQIQLTDYECLTFEDGRRILGFGRFAGLIGAYLAMKAWGAKHQTFQLPLPQECSGLENMFHQLKDNVNFGQPIKIYITGRGRVAKGIREILSLLNIAEVDAKSFAEKTFEETVFTNLDTNAYYQHQEAQPFTTSALTKNPEQFRSTFTEVAQHADIIITGHFYDSKWPKLIEQAQRTAYQRLKVLADISCDIADPIPFTLRPSTLADPFYDVDPESLEEKPAFSAGSLTVMAVDNLPGALPKDASEDFGKSIATDIIPLLLKSDEARLIDKASICKDGKLNAPFQYLQRWLNK